MTERDRSITTETEKAFMRCKQLAAARNNETMRVAGLIEMALYTADSEETQKALLDLAHKVLKP